MWWDVFALTCRCPRQHTACNYGFVCYLRMQEFIVANWAAIPNIVHENCTYLDQEMKQSIIVSAWSTTNLVRWLFGPWFGEAMQRNFNQSSGPERGMTTGPCAASKSTSTLRVSFMDLDHHLVVRHTDLSIFVFYQHRSSIRPSLSWFGQCLCLRLQPCSAGHEQHSGRKLVLIFFDFVGHPFRVDLPLPASMPFINVHM